MSTGTDVLKRLLVGRALRSDDLGHTLLPKRLALPVFATDALSSVGYATQEIMVVLGAAGVAAYVWTVPAAIAVGVVMLVVVASYRQNVRAYASGGGDYEVATTNIGPKSGVVVASALMVDYVMTVAVSVSSGVDTFLSQPALAQYRSYKVEIVLVCVALMMFINLRGVRESGKALALPVYAFIISMYAMGLWALVRIVAGGERMLAPTAHAVITPEHSTYAGLAMIFLVMRAFASGCTALTGIEAISNGVPAFRKPKSKNAASTLLLMGSIALGMFAILTALALYTKVRTTEVDANITIDGKVPKNGQDTVIAQVAHTVFSNFPAAAYILTTLVLIILVLAANTAFNGFPVLGSILARDGHLPRQLHTRGDRLAFSNGIVLLAVFAAIVITVFNADVTQLIQLYIVGVFVSFTVSQFGMVRHWNRHLRIETDRAERARMMRSRAVNAFGFCLTGVVLVVVVLTKFLEGAWLAIVAMVVIYLTMRGIHRHYDAVARELAAAEEEETTLPSRVHAIVLLSKLHKPAIRALAYARATRPSTLEAVTVEVDPEETDALREQWERRSIPVPLKVLGSPFREVTRPLLEYVRGLRRGSPRDVVIVFIPEYVVGHWWEHLLHNQSALRLKARLLFTPGVMVVSVPWQLSSSVHAEDRDNWFGAGVDTRGSLRGPRRRASSGDADSPQTGHDAGA